ncbi:uncharacterized protein LOC128914930 isoform X3 [Rissa tridactyla]|uniref:uncharacterized protein LOC128914930 isoform X3 n=1 Tax=Rissa tridactyla TaxID=75485 RepID=UPI0023BB0463|nr:uncharacterized protein LOC128914930 isoform X3 [Rissa tridactyla]
MTLTYGLILGGTAQPPEEEAGKGTQEILELLLKPHRRGHPGRGDTSALTVLLMGKKRLWRRTPSGVGEQRAPSPNLCHELLPPAGPPHLCGRAKGERASPGKEAEETKPQLSRDFSYREEEMWRLLWKKLHTGIPRPGEMWYTRTFLGRKRGTVLLGEQHVRGGVPQPQQEEASHSGCRQGPIDSPAATEHFGC